MVAPLSPKLTWELANPKWSASLNPILRNPLVNGSILSDIDLKMGANSVDHGLGKKLQGYLVILNSSPALIYDSQESNQMPDLTLIINASAPTTVSLYVF